MDFSKKIKKGKIYNFRISKGDLEKIKFLKSEGYNIPEILRSHINSIYRKITEKDIDDEIYR